MFHKYLHLGPAVMPAVRPDCADDQTILTAAYFLLRAIIGNNIVSEQPRTMVNLQRPHSGNNVLTVRGGLTVAFSTLAACRLSPSISFNSSSQFLDDGIF